MSRVILCVAALVVAAAAFPSNNFVQIDTYTTNALCTAATTTPLATSYYGLELCTVVSTTSPGISRKYALDANPNYVVYWSFSGTACAGTGTVVSNYTVGGCGTGSSKVTSLASSVGIYSTTSYSDSACATVSNGPTFGMQGCTQGTSITVGGKLEVCYGGSTTDCSGGTCVSLSHGECNEAQGSSTTGSVMYDWNSASSATPAVALTAALIAVVAAVTKF